MSQMFWNEDMRMKECGRKRAECGIQWDCKGKIESGQTVFITGKQVLNTSTVTRRPLILRAVMLKGTSGPLGWKNVLYERRNDCPEALETDQCVPPGVKGNFICINRVKSRDGQELLGHLFVSALREAPLLPLRRLGSPQPTVRPGRYSGD
jgi:hypothetical protein